MATYNGAKYIKEQLDSIIPQLREDDELIVSDDASKDDTLKIVESYNDPRIKIFHNENHGVAHNFENAMRQATGDLIYFADQDDVWLPGKLDKMEKFLTEGGYDTILCNCSLVDANLNVIKERHYDEKWPMKKSLLRNVLYQAGEGRLYAIPAESRCTRFVGLVLRTKAFQVRLPGRSFATLPPSRKHSLVHGRQEHEQPLF